MAKVKLEVMDFTNSKHDTGAEFELDDMKFMLVEIVSGDEILMPYFKDGKMEVFDAAEFAGNGRVMNFRDGCYIVDKDNFDAWTKREDTYEFLWCGIENE